MSKYILLLIICILWYIGGGKQSWARDVVVPIILGVLLGWYTRNILLGIWEIGAYQIIRLGYGNYSPADDPKPSFLASITHDKGGWWIRLIYGLIVATIGGIGLKYCHCIGKGVFIVYILGNGLIGFLISRLRFPRLFADLAVGAGVGSIIFL